MGGVANKVKWKRQPISYRGYCRQDCLFEIKSTGYLLHKYFVIRFKGKQQFFTSEMLKPENDFFSCTCLYPEFGGVWLPPRR